MKLEIFAFIAVCLLALLLGVRYIQERKEQRNRLRALLAESAALRAELALNHRQMDFLCSFARQLSGEMGFNEAIHIGLGALWQLPEIDGAAVVLGEDELGPFYYVGLRGIDDPFAYVGQECPLPLWGTLAHALVHQPSAYGLDQLIIDDIAAEGKPQPDEFPWLARQGSLLVVPLRGRGRAIGAVILHSSRPATFQNTNQQQFLYALVNYLARALLETKTHEQSARWVRHLVSLQLLTRTMTGVTSVERMLRVLCDEATDMFGPVAVHLFLQADQEVGHKYAAFCHYTDQQQLTPKKEDSFVCSAELALLLSWVSEADQPLFVDPQATEQSPESLYYRESGHGVLVPVFVSPEAACGVLLLLGSGTTRPFDESDLIVIRTIANSASVAIGNVRLSPHSQPIPVSHTLP
ncbi:MAG: GAF domain-containing protein [Caldilineaceae bacterium]|nr:GAF domain-containing protein [Caldilineaceae bacterium]